MTRADNLIVLDNRLIAFLDVLGFSNRMNAESSVEVVQQYVQFIAEANSQIFSDVSNIETNTSSGNFATTKFVFDSIVLISHPLDKPDSVGKFILATIALMEQGFQNKLPLRGAITLGDYVESVEQGVFVSSSFKELFTEEQHHEWSGCCVLEKATACVLLGLHGTQTPTSPPKNSQPLILYSVPVKGGAAPPLAPRWCLNWCYLLNESQISPSIDYLIEPKKTNTRDFLLHVSSLDGVGSIAVKKHTPPLYLRVMACRTKWKVVLFDEAGNRAATQTAVEISVSEIKIPIF